MNYFKVSKFFLLISVLAIGLVSTSTLFPFIVGKYTWFRTTVDLAVVAFALGLVFSAEAGVYLERLKKFAKKPLPLSVTIFVFFFILAGFFGLDPANSFWSNFERGEGGLQLLHLLAFFWLLVLLFHEDRDWRKIFWLSVIAGLLVVFYGVAAGLKYVDAVMVERPLPGGGAELVLSGKGGPFFQTFKDFIGQSFRNPGYRFEGSIGNSSYVGAYAIFILFYVGLLFVGGRNRKKLDFGNLVLLALGAVFLTTIYLAATRGAFLGFVAALIGFLGYFIYIHKTWRKWLFLCLIILVIFVGSMVAFQNTPFVKSLPASRIFDISFAADTFKTRMIMWQIAWDGFKARPILGWGPENFLAVFDQHFNIAYFNPTQGFGAWFDRAHSIYFDYLVETGILGFLSFLAIFAVFYWELWRRTKRTLNVSANSRGGDISGNRLTEFALLAAIPLAYLVQGIVLFDVLPIYINLFLTLAVATHKFENT